MQKSSYPANQIECVMQTRQFAIFNFMKLQ